LMGDVVLEGKLPQPMLRAFSCLMALQRAWSVFVLTTRKMFLSSKMLAPDWEFYGSGQKCHPSWTLNKLTMETGGEEWSSEQKVLPKNGTQMPGDWRGQGLRMSAYTVWPVRKDLVVMSQWAHEPWNLESPEAAAAWPVAMAAQPAKQKEAGGWCSCLVWKSSQLSGA
jgi:hypothetical protein